MSDDDAARAGFEQAAYVVVSPYSVADSPTRCRSSMAIGAIWHLAAHRNGRQAARKSAICSIDVCYRSTKGLY
jgi:hypothetical protein